MSPGVQQLVNLLALSWGAVTDWKRREIPNAVPVLLLGTGVAAGNALWQRAASALAVAGILLLSERITRTELPGGDFKLLTALTFSAGPAAMLGTLALTGTAAVIAGLLTGKRGKRNIPLCTYAAPAYAVLCAAGRLLET